MAYLVRLGKAPSTNDLTQEEIAHINRVFDVTPQTVTLNGVTFPWEEVTEIETALAARTKNPAGWFVKKVIFGGERYHVAIYAGRYEAVLPNTSRKIIEHIVQTIAYYAPRKIPYSGVEGISPVSET